MMKKPLQPRTLIAVGYDIAVACAAWTITFIARYNFSMAVEPRDVLLSTLPVVVAIQVACFVRFGLYRGIWRYASMHDMRTIAAAVGVSALIVPVVLLLWRHGLGVPRVLYFLNPLLLILFMGGGRIAYRWWKEHRQFNDVRRLGRPVLVLGAGDDARRLLTELERSAAWQVVGLLDENPQKVGRTLGGAVILGTWDEIAPVAARTGARHAILARPDGEGDARRRAFELCERAGLHMLIAPDLDRMAPGNGRIGEIRQIELDDLLRRSPVQLDTAGLAQLLGGRVVLVTGAGGSIGSELTRQIARFTPQALVLVESSEYALYRVLEDLRRLFPETTVWPLIGDVKDPRRVAEVFERFRPDIVVHAAAYKHVPMLEELNAWEAVRNNVIGTRVVARAALRAKVRKFVFVSTDKAVNPTNAMGASKRLAELMLLNAHAIDGLPVVIVRFGNVLGSSGSVIPKFRQQIARGGPVTVTHPEITRYFMSIPEATQLVLQAGLMGSGGETFLLDMGDPVRIAELARDMIRLSGFTEDEIPIVYSGLRPGEKLYEELLGSDETTLPTRHPKLRISRSMEAPAAGWASSVQTWLDSEHGWSDAEVRGWLRHFVPEYAPAPGLDVVAPSAAALHAASAAPADGDEAASRLRLVSGAGAPRAELRPLRRPGTDPSAE
ncbi:MAG: hypothetical protein RJA99_3422 [Pseudomonadota bacterium]|jgi:FlaA1/EpsC-like NDP-sugar epimerase